MSFPQIGSRYSGPSFDRPSLRQLPPGWELEETRQDRSRARWFQVRRWFKIAFVLALLLAYVAAVYAVLN